MGLTDYVDLHINETVWVLGSGASLQHISPSLFTGQTVIATNFSGTDPPLAVVTGRFSMVEMSRRETSPNWTEIGICRSLSENLAAF